MSSNLAAVLERVKAKLAARLKELEATGESATIGITLHVTRGRVANVRLNADERIDAAPREGVD